MAATPAPAVSCVCTWMGISGKREYFCLIGSETSPVYEMAASTTPPAAPAASMPSSMFGR
ncbi:hypothetical protein EYF80_005733 [Liparis tanakae]|uniref:Uncharacterized protein n=1 Tax=Liparis tanakae TaxID=230148 RepID=A0A4Z2J2Z8_9TELE|nr:hypothetical protein EYF80_005733 [Liparis tanakae]